MQCVHERRDAYIWTYGAHREKAALARAMRGDVCFEYERSVVAEPPECGRRGARVLQGDVCFEYERDLRIEYEHRLASAPTPLMHALAPHKEGGKRPAITKLHYRVAYANTAAAFWHAMCAALIVALVVLRSEKSPDIAYGLVTSVCAWVPESEQLSRQLQPKLDAAHVPHIMFQGVRIEPQLRGVGVSLSTTALVCAFSVLSALWQGYWAVDMRMYVGILAYGGVNAARYVEYSVSASVMLVLIALEVGLWDWGLLVGVATSSFACMIFGLLADISLYIPAHTWHSWPIPWCKPW